MKIRTFIAYVVLGFCLMAHHQTSTNRAAGSASIVQNPADCGTWEEVLLQCGNPQCGMGQLTDLEIGDWVEGLKLPRMGFVPCQGTECPDEPAHKNPEQNIVCCDRDMDG